ncbi:MAG: hypothetical protein AAF959_05620 [Cyanobacteria bacterium P01_D01_bin.56]
MGAFGIVLTPIFPFFAAEAFSKDQYINVFHAKTGITKLNAKQEEQASSDFVVYDSEEFSINYPRGWQVTPQENNGVAIISTDITMPIRTEINLLRENPDTVVPQKLEQIVASGVAVSRYSLVTVNGQSGFRIWHDSATGQQTLVTFIGYGEQQTAILTSSYTPNTEIETLVTTIHGSFINHSVAQATQP